MPDIFENRSSGLESPGYNAAQVTPDDGSDLSTMSRALYVGNTGDIQVTMAGGATVLLRNVPAGLLPLRVARVFASGTTATDIVAVW